MRVLTVRQPWAGAIIHRGKDVENRTRNIAGDYRGPVAIHVGLRHDYSAVERHNEIAGYLDEHSIYGYGYIIGVVQLWAVHQDRNGGNCCPRRPAGGPGGSPWAERGVWHLCLNDPKPLRTPLLWKGALGLRELPADVAEQIGALL